MYDVLKTDVFSYIFPCLAFLGGELGHPTLWSRTSHMYMAPAMGDVHDGISAEEVNTRQGGSPAEKGSKAALALALASLSREGNRGSAVGRVISHFFSPRDSPLMYRVEPKNEHQTLQGFNVLSMHIHGIQISYNMHRNAGESDDNPFPSWLGVVSSPGPPLLLPLPPLQTFVAGTAVNEH